MSKQVELLKLSDVDALKNTLIKDPFTSSEVVKANMLTVRTLLELGLPALVSVYAKSFYEPLRGFFSGLDTHAICISGYLVDEDGKCDVQVVDPSFGIYWLSLEHLSRSVLSHHSFYLSRVTEPNRAFIA